MFTPQSSIRNRHSDPTSFHQWPPAIAGASILERIDSKEELITNGSFSSSVDNLVALRKSRRSGGSVSSSSKNAKPVEPPKISLNKNKYNDATWAVDSSWEFISECGVTFSRERGENQAMKLLYFFDVGLLQVKIVMKRMMLSQRRILAAINPRWRNAFRRKWKVVPF